VVLPEVEAAGSIIFPPLLLREIDPRSIVG
jgi:hypothetical protein